MTRLYEDEQGDFAYLDQCDDQYTIGFGSGSSFQRVTLDGPAFLEITSAFLTHIGHDSLATHLFDRIRQLESAQIFGQHQLAELQIARGKVAGLESEIERLKEKVKKAEEWRDRSNELYQGATSRGDYLKRRVDSLEKALLKEVCGD